MERLVVLASFLVLPFVSSAPIPQLSVFGHKIPDTDAVCAAIAYVWELEERGISARAYRLGTLNRETEYVLEALGVESPPLLESLDEHGAVAIVDTNNPAELPDGVEKVSIHSIIDHHKLCGLKTNAPLEMDVRSLCSTGSILYARAKAAGRTPPPVVAGLMLSCILSDSLAFRSPTTTALDRELAEELARISGLDMMQHADAMLDAKADIAHLSPEDVVMMDSKVYEIGGRKLRISVVETTRPERALQQRAALVDAQRRLAGEQKLDDVLLFVVDVLNEQATFLASSPTAARLVEQAWDCTLSTNGSCVLPGVLSRKKQIIPTLEASAAAEPRTAVGVSPTAATASQQLRVPAGVPAGA
jgi:manganese-dependent inorganic pyrophosphatase